MRSATAWTLVAVVAAVPLVGAQPFAAQEEMCPDFVLGLVQEAKASVRLVDLQTFRARQEVGDYDLIVDVREPSEYASGHVPGAVNIPRGLVEFMIWPQLGFPETIDEESARRSSIFLYCNSGGRASLSGRSLQDLGFVDVSVVDMKLSEWSDAGFPMDEAH